MFADIIESDRCCDEVQRGTNRPNNTQTRGPTYEQARKAELTNPQ